VVNLPESATPQLPPGAQTRKACEVPADAWVCAIANAMDPNSWVYVSERSTINRQTVFRHSASPLDFTKMSALTEVAYSRRHPFPENRKGERR